MKNNSTTIMCPFCGSDTLVILDGEEGEFEMVSDCENCCRPISVSAKVDGGQVELIEAPDKPLKRIQTILLGLVLGTVRPIAGSLLVIGLLFFFGLVTTSAQLEVEPNNAFSDANEINFAEEIQGSFASSNDYDYYKVTLAKLQKVTVSFWTTDRLQTFGKVTASIYNSDKVLISSIKSTSPNKIDNVFMANVGELFIKVSRSSVGVDDNLSYFFTINVEIAIAPQSRGSVSVDDPKDMADSSGDIKNITAHVEGGNLHLTMSVYGVMAPSVEQTPEGMKNRYYYHWLIDTDNNTATGFKNDAYEGNPTGLARPLGVDLVIQFGWRDGKPNGVYAYDPFDNDVHLVDDYTFSVSGDTISAVIALSDLKLTEGQTVGYSAFQEGASDGWSVDWVESNELTLGGIPAVAPTITAQPSGQTIIAGNSASFSVTVSGTPSLTYQWKFGGVAIAGATASSLTLNNVKASDAGAYSVVVSNEAGSVESAPARLNVNFRLETAVSGKGVVGLEPSRSSYPPGTQVTLTAKPQGGHELLNWTGSFTSSKSEVTITMDGNKSVTANFVELLAITNELTDVKVVRIGQKVSFKFNFDRQPLRQYSIQRSSNLEEWTNDGPPIQALPTASIYRFSRTIDTEANQGLFYRVVVVE